MKTIGHLASARPASLQHQRATAAGPSPAAGRAPLRCKSSPPRPRLAPLAATSKKSGNGAGTAHHPAPTHDEMEDLVRRRYFQDLFTGGDYTLAPKILDPNVIHKDMVRDEAYCGVGEVVDYMRCVKKAYPGFLVRATTVAPDPEGKSMFVAFEGHAAEGLPTFRGVDVFYFNEEGKVCEVNVYRSNWAGAKGHAARKAETEAQMRWEAEQEPRRR